MNKVTAHAILGVFDIAAIAACLYVFSEWENVNELLDQNTGRLSVQSNLSFYGLMIMVPVTHLLTLFKWQKVIEKWGNRFLVALLLSLVVGAFIMDSYLENKILAAGYQYCASQSEAMTFSEYRTYIKGNNECVK